MTDPKAMPDEQTTIDLNYLFGDERREIRDISLRLDAHIAAQSDHLQQMLSIVKARDKTISEQARLFDLRGRAIDKLESDNKRLREFEQDAVTGRNLIIGIHPYVAEWVVKFMPDGSSEVILFDANPKAALAQTDNGK